MLEVVVARKRVRESSETDTLMPAASSAAVPVASGSPEQSLVMNRRTVEPASAEPKIFGELSLAGEAGTVAVSSGASGAAVSTVKFWVAEPGFPAASVARTRNV